MSVRLLRRVEAAILLLAAGLVYSAHVVTGAPQPGAPVVVLADVDSIIQPVSAEFMIGTIDRAEADHAALIIFTLRTPGGLVDSTRAIVTRMLAASMPIAVFVGPSGARAASAGFILTIAADLAAMAPGTHIGAAHPVGGEGEKMDETTSKKAAQDVAAYVRTLAAGRHRNVMLAEEAVNQSRAFTEDEALNASPPLIDLVVRDVPELLERLNGRTIRRFDGASATLRTSGAQVTRREMTLRQRVLSAIAHPNIAYLLLSLGMLGLTIELWTPGAVLPGVVGGVSLLLAFFALSLLPVNYAGLLLILLGLMLFALEIKVTSYGLLTVGGIVSLVFGSMILIDSPAPEFQLSLRLVLPVALAFAAIAAMLVRLGVAAQRQPAVTGAAGMIGESGRALTSIGPASAGRVAVHGEIWDAAADQPIPEGAPVRVVAIEGLKVTVRQE